MKNSLENASKGNRQKCEAKFFCMLKEFRDNVESMN